MKLHVFNPEHDLALANNDAHFVPPFSARKMAHDLALLPLYFADEGDAIAVPSAKAAERWRRNLMCQCADVPMRNASPHKPSFVPIGTLAYWHIGTLASPANMPQVDFWENGGAAFDAVEPWGWDALLVDRLRKNGLSEDLLPQTTDLEKIRRLSSRLKAVELLRLLREEQGEGLPPLCGESVFCQTEEDARRAIEAFPRTITKAPWSGSGKGLRFGFGRWEAPLSGWCKNVLKSQGGVCVEPFYDKVRDFALEFYSDGQGDVDYQGLSLFSTTVQGAYCSNLVASEESSRRGLLPAVSSTAFDSLVAVCREKLGQLYGKCYCGPLGVDMMLCRIEGQKCLSVHPCVEINVRQTMGALALNLRPLLAPGKIASFIIAYRGVEADFPPIASPIINSKGLLEAGTLVLTPFDETTRFRGELRIES